MVEYSKNHEKRIPSIALPGHGQGEGRRHPQIVTFAIASTGVDGNDDTVHHAVENVKKNEKATVKRKKERSAVGGKKEKTIARANPAAGMIVEDKTTRSMSVGNPTPPVLGEIGHEDVDPGALLGVPATLHHHRPPNRTTLDDPRNTRTAHHLYQAADAKPSYWRCEKSGGRRSSDPEQSRSTTGVPTQKNLCMCTLRYSMPPAPTTMRWQITCPLHSKVQHGRGWYISHHDRSPPGKTCGTSSLPISRELTRDMPSRMICTQ